MVTCPYHDAFLLSPYTTGIRLKTGNLGLEMRALSFNTWVRGQLSYGTAVARYASSTMAILQSLPFDLQIRAIAAIYAEDPEALVNTTPDSSSAHAEGYRSTGANGFTENGPPDDYDLAAGSVLGYRTWKLDGPVLTGAYGASWPADPQPGYRYTAECRSRGCSDVPNEHDCGCGYWAYWQPGGSFYSHNIIGAIEGSGKVILGENGFRSRYAVIKGLAPTESAWRSQNGMTWRLTRRNVITALAVYKVPVYDNVDEMVTALGTDPIYSPWHRTLSAFITVPRRDLEAYLMLLENIANIVKCCTVSPIASQHSKLNIGQEQSLITMALAHQRQHSSSLTTTTRGKGAIMHYGQGHYWCPRCGHMVYASRGGCGTCRRPLDSLMTFDAAWDNGYIDQGVYNSGGIGFDPFDGNIAFDIPGTDLAIEPDGQIDVDLGGIDMPLDGGGW